MLQGEKMLGGKGALIQLGYRFILEDFFFLVVHICSSHHRDQASLYCRSSPCSHQLRSLSDVVTSRSCPLPISSGKNPLHLVSGVDYEIINYCIIIKSGNAGESAIHRSWSNSALID